MDLCTCDCEVMYENYISCLSTEAETMVDMTETGILPACAKDLQKSSTANQKYNVPRKVAYEAIVDEFLGPFFGPGGAIFYWI